MAIKPIPAVSIQPADTVVALGTTVKLFASTSSVPIADYTWSPMGQLQDPLSLQPNTVPLFDNTSFTLDVQSTEGCTASATAVIHVAKNLLMPNAFSPNGDGANDIFRIPAGAPLKLSEFSIYDRWGRLLFSTSDISKGWDGTVNGIKVVSGVYAYLIRGTNDKGNVLLKGTVMLVR
jgi:gliding motility-associated-like protein